MVVHLLLCFAFGVTLAFVFSVILLGYYLIRVTENNANDISKLYKELTDMNNIYYKAYEDIKNSRKDFEEPRLYDEYERKYNGN